MFVGNLWFNGYHGQDAIILDDFYGWIEPATLYRLLDIYPLQVPIKMGFAWAKWNYVFITSNVRPEEFYRKEVMDKLDPTAYFRRFHRIGLMQKKYDEEENEEYIELEWQTYEDGVVPVEKPPILSKVKETFSNPSITGPRPFFDTEKYKEYREQKMKRLEALKPKPREELLEDFRVPASPEQQEDDGNQTDEEGKLNF